MFIFRTQKYCDITHNCIKTILKKYIELHFPVRYPHKDYLIMFFCSQRLIKCPINFHFYINSYIYFNTKKRDNFI